jgi:hypothetical protein
MYESTLIYSCMRLRILSFAYQIYSCVCLMARTWARERALETNIHIHIARFDDPLMNVGLCRTKMKAHVHIFCSNRTQIFAMVQALCLHIGGRCSCACKFHVCHNSTRHLPSTLIAWLAWLRASAASPAWEGPDRSDHPSRPCTIYQVVMQSMYALYACMLE